MKNLFKNLSLLLMVAAVGSIFSCKDENNDPTVVASFTYAVDATDPLKVNFTNTSTDFVELSWNFGDGAALSTDANPSHTYSVGGEFTVSLTATDKNGKDQKVASQKVTVSSPVPVSLTLEGGAWKIRNAANSIFVGPGLGAADWWSCPIENLAGTSGPADDWSCILDDEFIFNADGTMEYKTNGDARNDNLIFGDPNGCVSDAEIEASISPEFGSGIHTYVVVPAVAPPAGTGNDRIILTNGANRAAFIGFNKGYYGGENNGTSANGGNTTNEYEIISIEEVNGKAQLTVSVDISAAHDGSAAWTMVLVR
jgi:PKD repeat protein